MRAVNIDFIEMVQILLANGADVNAKDKDCKIVGFAESDGYIDIVQALLAKGANINAKDEDGKMPQCLQYLRS